MKPKFHFVDQRTDKWRELRRGIPTASNFYKIFTAGGKPSGEYDKKEGKIEWSHQALEYMARLVAEKVLKETFEDEELRGPWVQHGIECEPKALAKFAETRKLILRQVGFVTTGDELLGCSPDALVEGSIEAVEVKCTAPWTHMGLLLDGPDLRKYKPQVQGQLLIGEWDTVHFYAYHPRMPSKHIQTGRDRQYIQDLQDVLYHFCYDLAKAEERARSFGRYYPPTAEDA